jgi:hypothetical protein
MDVDIDLGNGEYIHTKVAHNGELGPEVDGRKLPDGYLDRLLEQSDVWTEYNRATGDEAKGKTTKDGE